MSEARGRPDANHCFVCGPDNPDGLRIEYRMDGDLCRAAFTPGGAYVGYDEMTHGGIIFSALDDVMANWLFLQGERAHTARCELRFREPTPPGGKLLLEGELIKRKGRFANLAGRAVLADTGQLVAEATATFMVLPD